jgi:beta-lactamase class A
MFQIIKNTASFALMAVLFVGCSYKMDIPTEFPTPPANPPATPAPKIVLKQDAELEKQIAKIAELAKGKVGVAAVLLETGDAALLNADQRFPMQSVYKLPISMAVMDQVRLGKLDLDEKIGVTKDDMVRAGMRSPLRDANPNGGEFTIRELIRLAIVESDGTASDVLMRILGEGETQSFLTQIGIRDMKVLNTEKEIGRDWQTQYDNYSTPIAAVELLRWLHAADEAEETKYHQGIEDHHKKYPDVELMMLPRTGWNVSLDFMAESNPGAKRLKGDLPPGAYVAHKTGTSGTKNGITAATNDIGIIRVPNGRRFTIAVFVSDSPADEKTREAVIAKIAKAVWDRWSK